MRPRYGGALIAAGQVEVTASVQTNLAAIYGKGMIYGGAVWLDYNKTQANSRVLLGCEGVAITDLSFYRMLEYKIENPRIMPVTINKFDGINFVYSAGISYGITFEISLILNYFEQHGFTPTVHYRLVYTLI